MVVIGVFTRNINGWATNSIRRAAENKGHKCVSISYKRLSAHIVGGKTVFIYKTINLVEKLGIGFVRPLGKCSLDEAMFRLDFLHGLEDYGIPIINPPSSIEIALNKFRTLHVLARNGIPVPETFVTENPRAAMNYVDKLKNKLVLKPLFGSRGLGSMLIEKPDEAWRILGELQFIHKVAYMQPFIEHGGRDLRLFVIDGEVVASMIRRQVKRGEWKTNIARGAIPEPFKPSGELRELAVRSAEIIGCRIAGVDIVEHGGEYRVLEVNSQPGWKGIQSVSRVNIAGKIVEYLVKEAKK